MKQPSLFCNQEKQEAIEVLNYQIRSCERCRLSVTRKQALTGEGNIYARIMFIGPAGQVLNKLLFLGGHKIFPLSHPASLLYNPSYEPDTREKYKKLQTLLHDCKWFSACPIKRFYETGRLDRKWIELYCGGDWKKCVRYEMEELGHYHPDWMLPDGSLDEKLKDYEL